MMRALALLAAIGCKSGDRLPEGRSERPAAPEAAPEATVETAGVRRDVTAWAGDAAKAAIADLDGDGVAEIVLVDARRIRVVDGDGRQRASAAVPGGIQVLVAADLDRDGRAEVLTGWGQTREHMKAPARIAIYRLAGDRLVEEEIATPATTRNDVTAIVPSEGGFVFAYFKTKYDVQSVRRSGGQLVDIALLPTATSYADLAGELVVGRIYGDERASDGDAFVLRRDGSRIPIPTTRGVRDVAVADTDGDGRAEVFLSDGWHQDYGKLARARLSWARRTNDAFTVELIEEMPRQFTAGHLIPADVDGDGVAEIISAGSSYVRVFDRHDGRWRALTVAHDARDVAAGDLDGNPGAELLVLGKRSEVVSLRNAAWP